MFKFLAQMFDQSLDKVLEPIEGKPYGQVMGRIGLILAASFLLIAMAVVVTSKGKHIELPPYHVVQEGKAPMRLPVLNSPSLSVDKITTWSSRALREIFTLRFDNVEQKINASEVYFQANAFEDFRSSMEKTKMIEKIRTERLFVVLTPIEDPQLVGRGVVNNQEVLRVEVPVVLTYIGGAQPVYQYQLMELFIRVVPTTEDPEGLAIARLKAHPYRK